MIKFSFFGYALAVSITLLLSWLVYKFLFESKVKPSINRAILLAIYSLALITPLISSLCRQPISEGKIKIGLLSLVDPSPENMLFVNPEESGFNIMDGLEYVYFSGMIIMLIITFLSVFKLYRIKKYSTKIKINGRDVYIHRNRHLASFSWFNKIFLYENAFTHDTAILLEHEIAHIRKRHWIDLMASQLFLIFQWFNPVVWIMKKELQQIHEYEADAKVLNQGYDEKIYQTLLLRNITNVDYPCFTDGFNNCSIKKRLLMMKKRQFKTNCVLRFSVIVFASIIGGTILYVPAFASIIQVMPTSQNVEKIESENLKNKERNSSHHVLSEEPSGNTFKINNERIKKPVYEGGEEKLKRDLAMRLRYPIDAYRANIQGTVVVQFTVTTDGRLTDFRIEHPINPELDVAAVNAVKDLPGRWTPGQIEGKITPVSYSLPISFKIQ